MMKTVRNLTILVMVLLIGAGTVFAGGGGQSSSAGGVTAYNLPRNETLYFNGLQWGTPNALNPYHGNQNNSMAEAGHRQFVFETLAIYNLLDGKLYPQIADSWTWNDSARTLTVQLNKNVKFWNGTALTSADVEYVFNTLAKNYDIGISAYWNYLDSVAAQGDYTVVFTAKAPPMFNKLQIEAAISEVSITSKAYWEGKITDGSLGKDRSALAAFTGWDVQGTGPYTQFYYDDVKSILIRNDNYWGAQRAANRYGKLPAPRYLAHNIYRDNAAGDEALRRGEVDVSQQFTAQIWTYFPQGVETYVPQAPYYIPGVIPMIIFNTTKPGLNDKAVRKAIAMALDYDMIGTNAMSGYTAPKQHHLMLPSPAEQALIDADALKPYQWSGIDIAGANALLDQAGWVRGADGIRAKGGVRLAFRVECPQGWSDWNASLEVVAQAGRSLGMDLTTYFPIADVWSNDRNTANFDIIMDSPGGQGITSPWNRARAVMGQDYLPANPGTPNYTGNFGFWKNSEVQAIIDQIPNADDATKRQLWTRLNIIYLDEMPAVGLMYRPWLFHQVSTNTWTGFPKINDGSNIPPTILGNGYGIKGLYNLSLRRR